MNKKILLPQIQEFIKNFEGDITKLAFSGSPFPAISVQELIQQIEGREKAKNKLDFLLTADGIYFPPKINLAQTSSQITANYKASLIKPGTVADLTGGLGIDTFHFSKNATKVTHFEVTQSLSIIAAHNFKILNVKNISVENTDGIKSLDGEIKYDTIYVDPSRRTEQKQKVFFLKDCEPNVPENIHKLLSHCNLLMIKTSPMLDIQVGLKELFGVYELHVVAVNNEVKELLWLCKNNNIDAVTIKTINLKKSENEYFDFNLNTLDQSTFGDLKKYIYEPNAAVLKAGGFRHISKSLGVAKLHKHAHLFTSETLIEFPGRRFILEAIVPYSKKEMKTHITGLKANVTTRNFPETVANLRKKWNLKDGGAVYLFFTTLMDNSRVVLKCSKISD